MKSRLNPVAEGVRHSVRIVCLILSVTAEEFVNVLRSDAAVSDLHAVLIFTAII